MLQACRQRTLLTAIFSAWMLAWVPASVSAQGSADKRLIQKTTLSGEAQTLGQVLEELCNKHKLKLKFDKESLDAEGIDTSYPLSKIQANGITVESALGLILEPLQLVYTVDKGTLSIESKTKADSQLVTITYPLTGLGAVDPDMLTNTLETMTSGLWEELDGEGGKIVMISPQAVTIAQSRSAHAEIAELLSRMAAALTGKRLAPSIIERSEEILIRTLSKPTNLPAGELTLDEVAEMLRSKLKINVVVLETALQDEGIDLLAKVTLPAEKQSAIAALTTALADKKLALQIRHEVLQITTQAMIDDLLSVRIYDSRASKRPADEIATQVVQMKDIGQWEDNDGIGGAATAYGPLVLIRQTAAAHEQLAKQLGPGK